MKKLVTILTTAVILAIGGNVNAGKFEHESKLSTTASTENSEARLESYLDYDWKWFHFHLSPDISYGTSEFYTTDWNNTAGRNIYSRSIFGFKEAYAEGSIWNFNAGAGYRIIDTGAVDEPTPLDTRPVDFLNINDPRTLSEKTLWVGYQWGNFEAMYAYSILGEGKLPLHEDNPWHLENLNLEPMMTHGGQTKKSLLRLRWSKDDTTIDLNLFDGHSSYQNFQTPDNTFLEPDFYPTYMVSTVVKTHWAGLDCKGGLGYIYREEWLDDTINFEFNVAKDFEVGKGILTVDLQTIQEFVVHEDKEVPPSSNNPPLWREIGTEHFFDDTYKVGFEYAISDWTIGNDFHVKEDLSWKDDAFVQKPIYKNLSAKLKGSYNDDFYGPYGNNNQYEGPLSAVFTY